MERLSPERLHRIHTFLVDQGLTFKPLTDDMTAHVACDLEERMAAGASFEEAWNGWLQSLSKEHFRNLQLATMTSIEKRFTISRGMTWLSLGLFFASIIFKTLHLPLAPELLILSFASTAVALVTGSLTGIALNRERKGALRILTVVAGALLMMAGYAFKLMHLPGANQLLVMAVVVTLGAALHNTLYVYNHASGQGNLLTHLHQKHTPGIERFLLILLLPIAAYRIFTLLTNDYYLGNIILIVAIFGAGLQFIALLWGQVENNLRLRTPSFLVPFLVCISCFVLPFLGATYLSLEVRIVMVVIFMASSAWLVNETEARKGLVTVFVFLVPILFAGWALCFLNVIPSANKGIFFNIPILIALLAGTLLSQTRSVGRAWMTMITAAYMFEYLL